MNIKEIEELIKFVSKSGVSEVNLEIKDFKISIKTNPKQKEVQATNPVQITHVPPVYSAPVIASAPSVPVVESVQNTAISPAGDDLSKYVAIKSPMIGTFYRSSSPDKPVFVNVGDEVKPGMVLCIIEAMKLFNEIECEHSGRIVKILADNASPIEYDQPLFLIDPS